VRRANEKEHVERLLRFARRSFLVPVPQNASLKLLNQQLREKCLANLTEQTRGKPAPKSDLLRELRCLYHHGPASTGGPSAKTINSVRRLPDDLHYRSLAPNPPVAVRPPPAVPVLLLFVVGP